MALSVAPLAVVIRLALLCVWYASTSIAFQLRPAAWTRSPLAVDRIRPRPFASVRRAEATSGADDVVVDLDSTHARRSLPSNVRLVPVEGKGLGVVANERIPARTTVGDYRGEILTEDEKDRRYIESKSHLRTPVDLAWIKSREERGQTLTGTYLYGVTMPSSRGPGSGLGIGMGGTHQPDRIYIDSEDEDCSLWTRFINHAGGRSANLTPKSIHESWDGKPRVWFVASRDIEEGEELCFDYGDDYWLDGDDVV